MAVLLQFLAPPLSAWLGASTWTRALWLSLAVAGGAAAYVAALLAVGIRPRDLRMRDL
jgi:peptidoglycan biosynthesis protein MviN/MurJ (putative lipid II flippase)